MGYTGETGDIVVTHAIGPGPLAKHREKSFVPDHDFQETEIARIYRESGRHSTYLGDWHSHPGGSDRLSWRDRATLRRISRAPAARVQQPVMVIIAERETLRIGAHQGRRLRRFSFAVQRLVIVAFENNTGESRPPEISAARRLGS